MATKTEETKKTAAPKTATKAPAKAPVSKTAVAKAAPKTATKAPAKAPVSKTAVAKTEPKIAPKKETVSKPAAKSTTTKTSAAVKTSAKDVSSKIETVKKVEESAVKTEKKKNEITGPKLRITLKRSTIGCLEKQKRTIVALGLSKINSQVVKQDNPCIRGMIFVVKHLISVEEVK